jgi:hypothetical protein
MYFLPRRREHPSRVGCEEEQRVHDCNLRFVVVRFHWLGFLSSHPASPVPAALAPGLCRFVARLSSFFAFTHDSRRSE